MPFSEVLGLFAGEGLHTGVHAVFVRGFLGLFEGREVHVLILGFFGFRLVEMHPLCLPQTLLFL